MKSFLLLLSLVLVAVSAFAEPAAYEHVANLSIHAWNNSNTTAASTLPLFAAGLVALGIARRQAR